jgi:hypothetical protein
MESILENRYVFYVVIFICFLNLMADVAAREFLFVFLFLAMIFVLDFFIDNKTLLLFLSFMISNVLLLKFKYNQMKYYYLYLQGSDKKSQIPSYV